MKRSLKIKLFIILAGLFTAFAFLLYLCLPIFSNIAKMFDYAKSFREIKWTLFLNKMFIFFLIVDASIIGVFIKNKFGWMLMAFTFYLFAITAIISIIMLVTSGSANAAPPGIGFLIGISLQIWLINTKEIAQHFKVSNRITMNLVVIFLALSLISIMQLTRNI